MAITRCRQCSYLKKMEGDGHVCTRFPPNAHVFESEIHVSPGGTVDVKKGWVEMDPSQPSCGEFKQKEN